MWGLRFVYLRFSVCLVICVITRTVNIAAFVSGIFDLFDGHFDGQNGYAFHFTRQSVRHL